MHVRTPVLHNASRYCVYYNQFITEMRNIEIKYIRKINL